MGCAARSLMLLAFRVARGNVKLSPQAFYSCAMCSGLGPAASSRRRRRTSIAHRAMPVFFTARGLVRPVDLHRSSRRDIIAPAQPRLELERG
jgi:hypothetical protein